MHYDISYLIPRQVVASFNMSELKVAGDRSLMAEFIV